MDALLLLAVAREVKQRLRIEEKIRCSEAKLELDLYNDLLGGKSLLKRLDFFARCLLNGVYDEAAEIDCFADNPRERWSILISAVKLIVYQAFVARSCSAAMRAEIEREIDEIERRGD